MLTPSLSTTQKSEATSGLLNFTDMETALAADRDGVYRKQLLAQLMVIEITVRQAMQRFLPREAYTRSQAALVAVTAAREVLDG